MLNSIRKAGDVGGLSPSHTRIWSLWDMLEFKSADFYRAVAILQRAQGRVQEITQQPPTAKFAKNEKLNTQAKKGLRDRCTEIKSHLLVLEAEVTCKLVDRLIARTKDKKKPLTWGDAYDFLNHVDSRLRDELSLHRVFVLEKEKEKFFQPKEPLFGKNFEAKFPTGAAELDEAAKCFALGRPTACVFHLMRLMECGLKSTAACLSNPPPTSGSDRNWGNILQNIKDAREVKTKGNAWINTADKEFFADAFASLDAVRVAWRNTTMHVEKNYTDDQAEHVLIAVKGFMTKLAFRMNENGEPKA